MMMKKKVVVGKSFIHRRKRKQLVGGWVGFFDKQNRWGCLEGHPQVFGLGFEIRHDHILIYTPSASFN
jgi:hypothetical protein